MTPSFDDRAIEAQEALDTEVRAAYWSVDFEASTTPVMVEADDWTRPDAPTDADWLSAFERAETHPPVWPNYIR